MEMTSLRQLHRSMIAIGSDMQQFLVRTGAASFDCLFSTRDTPSFSRLRPEARPGASSDSMSMQAIGFGTI